MIIVTGGAGFIGSALVGALNSKGYEDIVIVDHLGLSEKWQNLRALRFNEYLEKDQFLPLLESGKFDGAVESFFHLGACSATTERDASYLVENNYRYSIRIGEWWERNQSVRLLYASSAATYGEGEYGYLDNHNTINSLRPLNMYGYSKQIFDQHALKRGWLDKIVGLKFFNVFGPNEQHKGDMRSVVNKAYERVRDQGVISLFKSYVPHYGDGEQKRDFIYVKDAVAMTLWLNENSTASGIFNIGTGDARSWNDLAGALFSALHQPVNIEYIEMPQSLRAKYQYFTQADLSKLRSAGCQHSCMSLEDAVYDYVNNYMNLNKFIGD